MLKLPAVALVILRSVDDVILLLFADDARRLTGRGLAAIGAGRSALRARMVAPRRRRVKRLAARPVSVFPQKSSPAGQCSSCRSCDFRRTATHFR